jgi:glycosyltransferase involved in cell wall biosynthesis
MPRISIVMPVNNCRAFLEQSVRSLLAQTLTDFELIVGDDGSDDGTGPLLDRLAAEDGRIRVVRRSSRSGLAGSANWVVAEARARLVAIAHADDVSAPRRLERLSAFLEAHPEATAVGTPALGIDEAGRAVQPPNLWRLLHPSPFAPFAHSSMMFRKAAFDAVGGYRRACDYFEDLDLWWRLADLGPVFVLPEPLVRYRHWQGSSRGQERAMEVERAHALMYRCADLHWRHESFDSLLGEPGHDEPPRIRPRIFVARSWLSVWQGARPRVFRGMMARAQFGLDFDSLQSTVFVAWATLSPRSLRLFLRIFLSARNRVALLLLGGAGHVLWRSRRPRVRQRARSERASAA